MYDLKMKPKRKLVAKAAAPKRKLVRKAKVPLTKKK